MNTPYNKELHLKAFVELKGKTFHIPYQQRGYKWTKSNVEELLNDLREFIACDKASKKVYCLQPLAVVPLGGEKYRVLDGQQRLTTLYLLHMYLYGNQSSKFEPYTFEYERDSKSEDNRYIFLQTIASQNSEQADKNSDFFYIYTAYHHISYIFEQWGDETKQSFKDLLERPKEEKSLQVIWYEVEEAKQYETFRNLNSGKIHLTNTDLIKALLLNRVSGLPSVERMEAAAIFEGMERDLQNDHFWYMINGNELRGGQTRMDFLFNLVAKCKQSDYEIDSRWSFRNYFANPEKGSLSQKWKAVRHTFLRLKDMYNDIYSYHYIGVLTYNSNTNPINNITNLLEFNRKHTHSEFIDFLKSRIKTILTKNHKTISDYNYYTNKKDLRLLFLMHNIETILQRYKQLHEDEVLNLEKEYEKFPFELLHKQSWDIEHISSNTDSDFKNSNDREAWLESIKEDLGDEYTNGENSERIEELEKIYNKRKEREDFNKLYTAIMRQYDDKVGSIKDNAPDGKNKMQIGNLTLLDSSTNRSYHNALFPRKRRYIIVTDGISDKSDNFEKSLTPRYIPPCTRQVFTKAYNKTNKLSLNAWTQQDADFYVKDIEQKLSYYFNNKNI